MISNQSLTCPKGTSLTFEIDMDTGSDLTGATAQWALCESWFDNAKVYLTKTGVGDGLFIGQDAGIWKITVNIAPSDTLDVPSGLLYHDCKVLLQSGDVEDVANGPFSLDPSVNILNTNAPVKRNIRGVQSLGTLGQAATGTVGALARNLQAGQILGDAGQSATATSGGVTWVGPTWSLTDHSEYVGISGAHNEVATRISSVGGQAQNARSDTSQTTGTRLVEITITYQQSFTAIGLGTGAAALNATIGYVATDTVAYTSDGHTLRNGSFVDVMPTYVTGDVIGMAIDLDANTVSYSKNGGSVLATDDISALRPSSDPIFIMVSLIDDSTSNSVTMVNI